MVALDPVSTTTAEARQAGPGALHQGTALSTALRTLAARLAEPRAWLAQPSGPLLRLPSVHRHLATFTFVGGLLLGWLLIGWWLWPVQWVECSPWELRAEHQRRYIALVAAEHWRTRDAAMAQRDVLGWEAQALSSLLVAMEAEAPHAEARQQVALLHTALALQSTERSLWARVLRHGGVFWSAAAAAVLLSAALALVIAPPRFIPASRSRAQGTRGASPATPAGTGDGAPGAWLEAFETEEDLAVPLSESDPEAEVPEEGEEKGTEGASGARQVQRFSAQAENATESQAVELGQALEEPDLLSEIFESLDNSDTRLETLSTLVQQAEIASLVQESREVLWQLHALTAASSGQAG